MIMVPRVESLEKYQYRLAHLIQLISEAIRLLCNSFSTGFPIKMTWKLMMMWLPVFLGYFLFLLLRISSP